MTGWVKYHILLSQLTRDTAMSIYRTFVSEITDRLYRCGFLFDSTGGGCTAYVRRDGKSEELITIDGTADAPTALTDPISVGYYEAGECMDTVSGYTLADAIAALENPSDEYHLLSLRLENGLHKAVAR